ncbi:MAG TPA: endonuclease/exonuclease/phosphatase family protein [Gemmatimonadales bacterium]|nr:endonuclease/exonuclease/phosphatase family protein [Gemmatimonadales bacterium]
MRVVTYNLQYATRIDRALEVIRSEPDLAAADVLSLQEVDGPAVDRVAGTLGMHSAWYPAAIHRRTGRHFAPAVLSRWPIVGHRLLELPHRGLHGLLRVAVHARIERGPGDIVDVVAVHFGTMREILFAQQEAQARVVVESVSDLGGPVVVAGDLNRMGLGRVFEKASFDWVTRRVGLTHHVWSFDHVFTRGLSSADVRTGSVKASLQASDHRAVWAVLGRS